MPAVIIRLADIEKDAEALAAMWNESDLEWPGSWTRGVPLTAENMHEWVLDTHYLAVYVAEVEGKIVGLASFIQSVVWDEGEGYLWTLNVHPQYQKLSIGRRLIQATIEQAVRMGWPRQTLHTWAANFKAVPLYKKTGHFWTPNSSAFMQNFIPGALQLSLAKPFFERHDWYRAYVRSLDQKEDDQRWEGLKVYTEHWEAGGEALTIWIDRETRAPVAVETDALQVAAIAQEIEPLAGSATSLRYRFINKGHEPLQVALHAQGDEGLKVDYRDLLTVPAGETAERIATVQVAPDAPHSKADGSAPAVRSILRLNGQDVELFSGLRARKPLTLDTEPAKVTLLPGVPLSVNLQLHSALPEAVDLGLWLTVPKGLTADWTHCAASIGPEGHLCLPVTLCAAEEGVYALAVRAEPMGGGESTAHPVVSETLSLLALGPGGILAQREGSNVRLETDLLRVTFEAREGIVACEEKARQLRMFSFRMATGRPYFPQDLRKVNFDLNVEQVAGRAVVHAQAELRNHAGLILHYRFALAATGLGTMCYWLENRGSAPYTRRLRLHLSTSDRGREEMTLPLAKGLVRSAAADYPMASDDAPRDPAAYAEPWIAWEREGLVAGILWDRSIAQVLNQWQIALDTADITIAPGESSPQTKLGIYVGRGDWRAIQGIIPGCTGTALATEKVAAPRPPALAHVEPGVLASISNEVEGRLLVDTAFNRALSGTVHLKTMSGLAVKPTSIRVQDLVRGQVQEHALRFSLTRKGLGVYRGEARLVLPTSETAQPFYLLRLGTEDPVTVTEGSLAGQPVWTVDNGIYPFQVAPHFGPSVIAWMQEGANQLYSAFPKEIGFSWVYPWFGGIGPRLILPTNGPGIDCLGHERFGIRTLEAPDAQGLPWRGVRLSAHLTREELKDLAVEVDFTTLGGSNVLKYTYRVHNLRSTAQTVHTGSWVAAQLMGDVTELALHGEGLHHRPTPWATYTNGQTWGALTNERTGKALLLVARQGDVSLSDWGCAGRSLGSQGELHLKGGEVREQSYYLVLVDSLEQAQKYVVLADYLG